MKLVIAPDSFKESLDAEGVAHAIAKGIESTLADVDIHCVPVADGGEGTTEALIAATYGQQHTAEVTGPLGQPLNAIW
ncbi:MAG: glycerate kinase, partial [Marinobacterium sp.]